MTDTLRRFAGALAAALLLASCGDLPAEPTPPASLIALTATPSVVVGGGTLQLSASLSTAAPSTGALIELVSSDAAAQVPSSLVVPEGSISASVSVPTSQVTAERAVAVSGTYRGITQSITLRITP